MAMRINLCKSATHTNEEAASLGFKTLCLVAGEFYYVSLLHLTHLPLLQPSATILKRIAAHQTVTSEVLNSCGARSLQPVQPLYFDALLREPCPVVLQGDYAAVTRAAEGQLAQPGALSGSLQPQGLTGKHAGDAVVGAAEQQQLAAKQLQVIQELQHTLLALQQEQDAVEQQLLLEQQQQIGDDQQLSRGPSPGPAYGGKSLPVSQAASPEKLSAAAAAQQKRRQGQRSKRRAAAAQAAADDAAPAAVAGQTPLMQRLEQLKLAKQLMQAQQQQAAQALVEAESCSVLDVRQWLLAGLLASLKKDAAAVVARARCASAQDQQDAACGLLPTLCCSRHVAVHSLCSTCEKCSLVLVQPS